MKRLLEKFIRKSRLLQGSVGFVNPDSSTLSNFYLASATFDFLIRGSILALNLPARYMRMSDVTWKNLSALLFADEIHQLWKDGGLG